LSDTARPRGGFRPVLHFGSVLEIPPDLFAARGVRAVALDVDNTITRWELESVPGEILDWIAALKSRGLSLALVSNGVARKLKSVEEQTGVALVPGKKPFLSTFVRCREFFGAPDSQIAIVGDQCVTDIWPANRLGWLTVLVEPMSRRDFIGTHIYRAMERAFGMRRALEGGGSP